VSDDLRVALERSSGRRSRSSSISGCGGPASPSPRRLGVRRERVGVSVFALQDGRFGAFALPLTVVVTGR
jgi:hypothetical protein